MVLSKRLRALSALVPLLASVALPASPSHAQSGLMIVRVDRPSHAISPTLYGLMTEEINHSYDGGLYAELIQNRAFKDSGNTPVHWSLVQDGDGKGAMTLDTTQPLSQALGTSLRLDVTAPGQRVGIANDGYWGIPVKPNTRYQASFYARGGGFSGPLTVDIESNDGKTVYAQAVVPRVTDQWQQYTVTLTTGKVVPTQDARFVVSARAPGTVWLNLVSLFPPTYNHRPNGSRPDLMRLMTGLHPTFLRLPGGNYLEGNTIAERFAWKDTIGPLTQRPGHNGPWGYRSSDGQGLLEFLEWCEDLRIQPVLAVYAGYSLGGEHVDAGPKLQPFVQDALDEIQYVTGGTDTRWGAERARDGHPKPFPLTYVEVGNEDFFDKSGSYDGRFAQFYDAIKAADPRLQIIATTGVKSRTPDLQDDHYYRSPAAMEVDADHYDQARRTGPKVFVGEWASQEGGTQEGNPTPDMNAALGDAAWMTGLERDSDVVLMQCYAPLFVNIPAGQYSVSHGGFQWPINLIGYDALSSFGSPSYYAQAMFAANRGDIVLPVQVTQPIGASPALPPLHGGVGVATWLTQAEFRNVTVTQGGQTLYTKDFAQGDTDWKTGNGTWQATNGVLSQTGDAIDSRATAGSPDWTDYTYSLQARKTGGAEGFLIMFHVQDSANFVWWNIGGWGNTRSQMEISRDGDRQPLGPSTPDTVETGRWYDIKIVVTGTHIQCYLDGRLVAEADDSATAQAVLFTEASRDKTTGDVILKVVNIAPAAVSMRIALPGARSVDSTGTCQVLMGNPQDLNSLADPRKVVPVTVPLTDAGTTFTHRFPAHSVNVLRLHVH